MYLRSLRVKRPKDVSNINRQLREFESQVNPCSKVFFERSVAVTPYIDNLADDWEFGVRVIWLDDKPYTNSN